MKTFGTASWAFLKTPDSKFEPCWRITVSMSDSEAKKMKDLSLVVKRNDDGAFEYKFKRNVNRKKGGGENPPPQVVDANKNPFEGSIGNGSTVNVQWAPFNWEWKGKKGVSADLQRVQVVSLVPYIKDDSDDEFDTLGDQEETQQNTNVVDEF